jgi:hypothetical protein
MASSGTESGSAQPEGEATVKQPQYRSDIGKLANPNTVRCGAALTHVTVLLTPLPAGASEERPGGLGSGGLAMGEMRGHGSEIRHLQAACVPAEAVWERRQSDHEWWRPMVPARRTVGLEGH